MDSILHIWSLGTAASCTEPAAKAGTAFAPELRMRRRLSLVAPVVVVTLAIPAFLVRPWLGRQRMTFSGTRLSTGQPPPAAADVQVVQRLVRVAPAVPAPETPAPPAHRSRARDARPGERRSALARLFFGNGEYRPRPFPRPAEAQRPTER
jgi:hypothetical protein